tara:strand:- start:2813 stop:3082 length:270 start_codon:yes stop_codon:yes gene_type:complete
LKIKLKTKMDNNKSSKILKEFVSQIMKDYFEKLDGHPVDKVYNLVIGEVEKPLIEETIKYCNGNQSKSAALLGISRGTLRKKIKQYDIN